MRLVIDINAWPLGGEERAVPDLLLQLEAVLRVAYTRGDFRTELAPYFIEAVRKAEVAMHCKDCNGPVPCHCENDE